jgi:hypothetical protein
MDSGRYGSLLAGARFRKSWASLVERQLYPGAPRGIGIDDHDPLTATALQFEPARRHARQQTAAVTAQMGGALDARITRAEILLAHT